ncbi:MAG: hypothetical protein AAF797_03805 [Planctomycetota bacterium]
MIDRFVGRLRGASNRVELAVYPGQGHGFFNPSRSQAMFEATIARAWSFLGGLGWLTPAEEST